MEPAYTISSPGAFGSGELKNYDKHTMKNAILNNFGSYNIYINISNIQSVFSYPNQCDLSPYLSSKKDEISR